MELLTGIAVFALNLVVLFFVVRKATRADAQIDLLRQLVASNSPTPEKSNIQKLTEERKRKGA